MTIGYILILAILVLGGAIATIGDRLGTRVGKARLSLFKLRPRQTAVLITIFTGLTISGSTLGILFATSKPLRQGIFEFDEIQKKLRNARKDLDKATAEKTNVENELAQAKTQKATAQIKLNQINQSLQTTSLKLNQAIAKQKNTEDRFNKTQSQLKETVLQKESLQSEIKKLQQDREKLLIEQQQIKGQIAQRDRDIAKQTKELYLVNQELANRQKEITQQYQQLKNLEQEKIQQQQQITQLNQQQNDLNKQLEKRNKQLGESNQLLAKQSAEIIKRDRELQERENLLKSLAKQQLELETQQSYLKREIQMLEEDFKELRLGNVALRRGQILASGVVRILNPKVARNAVDQLLQQANQTAIKLTQPPKNNINEQIIQITNVEVDQLIGKIDDGQDYIIRILAAANYLKGETRVQVFADAAINKAVFQAGEILATTSVDPTTMTPDQMQQRIDQLIVASNFRARGVGILDNSLQIGDGRVITIMNFLEQLKNQKEKIDVQAIVSEVAYTSGPLKLQLVAIQNGQIIFRT